MSCFQVKGGKTHRLVESEDTDRFPLGRARCAPFPRLAHDALVEPNQVSSKDFCKLCL